MKRAKYRGVAEKEVRPRMNSLIGDDPNKGK